MGAGAAGSIESFLPAMMLAILFGLSMGSEVFLVSRIHKEWLHTQDNSRAVRVGQAATSRVITAAAVIMICVCLAFVFGGMRIIAEFRPLFQSLVGDGTLPSGYATDDGAGLLYQGRDLMEAVRETDNAGVNRVRATAAKIAAEERLEVRRLR